MKRSWVIQTIWSGHRYRLLLTYSLYAVEMLGLLLRPYFLGEAVNGLIRQSYQELFWLIGAHLLWVVTGTIRHRYDSRTYSDIYTALVVNLVNRNPNKSISRLSAHSTLSRELIDFLEFDLQYIIEAAYNILGSLVLLFFYDAQVVLICLSTLLPVSLFSYWYGRRMRQLNRNKHDELEQQVEILSSRNPLRIKQHYSQLRKWQVKISDQEAWNFGVMELLVLALLTSALLVSARVQGAPLQAGDYIGIYTYILKFVGGLDTIPYAVQRVAALRDILQRVETQGEELEHDPEPFLSEVA
ncbi:MAG TPA: ABC transporter six-transmembrane domain-containing protein [Lacibacter sp.]|nr:ABC transporter six-transmembrane domain-containing protein [Lacibacter sp.]HMO90295.1 ABC transporter six-transmembrane domain-containing protein [Lacibacter sp.]HMP88292.1 ABC transporter six-transmembrane domain-containing protein [Lacibacter sp.]